jgi:hypothetical protein
MSQTLGWAPHGYTPEELARGDALTAELRDWAKRCRAAKDAGDSVGRAALDAEYAKLLERERAFRQEHAGKSMPAERILAPTYPTEVQAAFDALRAEFRAWVERLGPWDRVHGLATLTALRQEYIRLWDRWLAIGQQFGEVEWDLSNLVPWDPVCALWYTTQRILAVGHKVRPDRVLDELSQGVKNVTQAGASGLALEPPPGAHPRKATPETTIRAVRAVRRWIRRSVGEPGLDLAVLPLVLTASDLARLLRIPVGRMEVYLRRLRRKLPWCCEETEYRQRNKARYLYHVADVMPHLKDHFGLS